MQSILFIFCLLSPILSYAMQNQKPKEEFVYLYDALIGNRMPNMPVVEKCDVVACANYMQSQKLGVSNEDENRIDILSFVAEFVVNQRQIGFIGLISGSILEHIRYDAEYARLVAEFGCEEMLSELKNVLEKKAYAEKVHVSVAYNTNSLKYQMIFLNTIKYFYDNNIDLIHFKVDNSIHIQTIVQVLDIANPQKFKGHLCYVQKQLYDKLHERLARYVVRQKKEKSESKAIWDQLMNEETTRLIEEEGEKFEANKKNTFKREEKEEIDDDEFELQTKTHPKKVQEKKCCAIM